MTRKRQVRGEPSPSPPSPSAPPPRGDSPSIHCHGGDFFSRFQARNSPKILSPRRGTVSGSIATHCPPPLEGAGGGRGSGRAVGVSDCRSTRDAGDRGGWSRLRLPPPRQPHPHGGDSPAIHCHGGDFFSRFQARNSSKILSPPLALYPGQSPLTARPLLRGREEALMSGRAVGVVTGRDAHREWFESIVNGGVKFPTCYREEVERFISRNC